MGSATGPFVRCFSMTVVPPFLRNPMMTLGGGPPSTFNAQRDNPAARAGAGEIQHEPPRRLLRQCPDGKLLQHPETRACSSAPLLDPRRGHERPRRLHRRLLQSHPAALRARRGESGAVRNYGETNLTSWAQKWGKTTSSRPISAGTCKGATASWR